MSNRWLQIIRGRLNRRARRSYLWSAQDRRRFELMRAALQEAFEYFDSCYDGPDNDTDGMGNTFYRVEEALRAADMHAAKDKP